MNENSEMEDLLAKSTPLPCSIDSMELMFAAGVEQQKLRSRHQRRLSLTLGSCAGTFLISTLVLGWMNLNLSSKNSELVASLNEVQRSTATDEPRKKSDAGIAILADHKVDQKKSVIEDDTDIQLTSVSRQPLSANRRSSIHSVLQRGVTLDQWDEYRDPADGYLASEPQRVTQTQQISNPYIRLRQELQDSMQDASQGL